LIDREHNGRSACSAAWKLTAVAVLVCAGLSGCAALTNPVANGIPVPLLPPELLAEPKDGKETIPLAYLRRKPPERYELGPGAVLSVYIEGVLGERGVPPPVSAPELADLPPAVGYPVPVRDNGTLPLPLIEPIKVEGMTVEEAEEAIIDAYTTGEAPILQPGRERLIVSLLRPRQVRVLVVRQDSARGRVTLRRRGILRATREIIGGAEEIIGGRDRGTGTIVNLPAYENDVLTALAYTGGLPGLDAANEVIIQRGYMKGPDQAWDEKRACDALMPGWKLPLEGDGEGLEVIRIPLRICPGEPAPFKPEDVVLHTGDIVFIEARDTEVFYAGGLLPTGEYPLPRDYDLDVVEAIAVIGGPLVNGGINTSNLDGNIIEPGIGAPSPRLATVLRRVPGQGQVPIRVDLHRALRDPRENLIVQAGDMIILQETKTQAMVRYLTQVFNFSVFSDVIRTSRTTGTVATSVP
jgi:protein involved in polysaccharide export with SLBB domain